MRGSCIFWNSAAFYLKFQCGGRRFCSTLDHLVRLELVVRDAFAAGEHVVAVSFDMAKAYDMTCKYGILRDLQRSVLEKYAGFFL